MALDPAFVITENTQFALNGSPFPVVGVNCYFLSFCSDEARASTLTDIEATGANVIRTLGFLDCPERPESGPFFQYGDNGEILINDGPDGLARLDHLISLAEEREFRLILPLVNYWNDFGGMQTYLSWLFPREELDVVEFYRRPEAKAAYKNWVGHLLNRRNSLTGMLYKDSPAILAWELANEPRCAIPGGRELLLGWTQEMSRFIKSQDPNHLVALGDEGFLRHDNPPNHLYTGEYGVDFEAILGLGEIDFGSYHLYPAPEQMNFHPKFGLTWIGDHIAAASRANKPALLEEYGLKAGQYGVKSNADRDAWYARWQAAICNAGGAGDLLWMFGSPLPELANYRDDYTVYSAAEVPSLGTHAEAMRQRSGFCNLNQRLLNNGRIDERS